MAGVEEVIQQWWGNQPHPQAPSLKVSEYPLAARMATVLKFGQESPGPQEVAGFWREFQTMNQSLLAQKKMPIGPEEFTQLAKQMARSSYTYHGRPPSMYEIQRLRDAEPKAIHEYFGALPDEHYPTVTAADMAKALHAAQPWAQQYLNRDPVKLEGAYLIHSGQSARDYYQALAANGGQDRAGSNPGVAGAANVGGQSPNQRGDDSRLASGPTAPRGTNGVPPR